MKTTLFSQNSTTIDIAQSSFGRLMSFLKKHRLIINVRRFSTIISAVTLCVAAVSCSDHSLPPEPEPIEGKTLVRMTVNTPQGYSAQKARNSQIPSECTISEIQLLVFEGGTYKYRAAGNIVSTTTTTTTFNVMLRSSSAAVKLYLLANANDAIAANEPATGGTEAAVKTAIAHNFTNGGLSNNFPMYGEYTFSGGLGATSDNTISNVKMLRAVARIDITKDPGVANFRLLTVRAFRANNLMRIIPNAVADPMNPVVTVPTIPSGAAANVQTKLLKVTADNSVSQLYLPESVAPAAADQTSDATCVVIGGFYNGSTDTTYYRIDFNSGVSGHPFGQILRNYRYVFNLTAVNGPGWNTPEEAATNKSTNVTVSVANWDDNTTNMVFDGASWFGVSTRKAIVEAKTGDSAIILVDTDLTGYTLQWASDAAGTLVPGTPSTTIQNTLFSATVSPDLSKITIKALGNNTSGAAQVQYMVVFAGRWKVAIEINQLIPKDYSGVYVNILSIGSIGNLGWDYPLNPGNAGGIRPILTNLSNFGPTGIVKVGGLGFSYWDYGITLSHIFTASACAATLSKFDIVNVTWDGNPGPGVSQEIKSWLQADPHRVLFVSHDHAITNANLINLFENGTAMWGGGNVITSPFKVVAHNTQNDYYTHSGPFGAISPSETLAFSALDITWLGIKSTDPYASELIPLVTCTLSSPTAATYYIISIDKTNRIVYIGDANLYQSGYGLSNSGLTNYDQAKLIANIYAWAIDEVILPGKR